MNECRVELFFFSYSSRQAEHVGIPTPGGIYQDQNIDLHLQKLQISMKQNERFSQQTLKRENYLIKNEQLVIV